MLPVKGKKIAKRVRRLAPYLKLHDDKSST
jgi:hypothetical protein